MPQLIINPRLVFIKLASTTDVIGCKVSISLGELIFLTTGRGASGCTIAVSINCLQGVH